MNIIIHAQPPKDFADFIIICYPKRKDFKNNNNVEYKIESLEKYDDKALKAKIRENLNKMYNYYMEIYPGDVNKLKCKFYILIYFYSF